MTVRASTWRVNERREDFNATILLRLCDDSLHLCQRFGSGFAVFIPKDDEPNLGGADVMDNVKSDTFCFQQMTVLRSTTGRKSVAY